MMDEQVSPRARDAADTDGVSSGATGGTSPGDPEEMRNQAIDEARRAAAEAASKAADAAREVGKELRENASEAVSEIRQAAREATDRARVATADALGRAKEDLESPRSEARSPLAADPSSTGFDANLAAALSYVFAPITGPLFFIVERKNRFVRFHALQSILFAATTIVLAVVVTILGLLPGVGPPLFALVSFGLTIVWLLLMWKALQWEEFQLPFIGDIARTQVDRHTT